MRQVILVIHNVRSAQNVGSMLRTADGLGVEKVYLTGYTPYPANKDDVRLPHIQRRVALQLHKTALGAEFYVKWDYQPNISECLKSLSGQGYLLAALEQTPQSVNLNKLKFNQNIALIVGNEIKGLEKSLLKRVKIHLQIPMSGQKESFNVAVAAAIAIYHLKYIDKSSA